MRGGIAGGRGVRQGSNSKHADIKVPGTPEAGAGTSGAVEGMPARVGPKHYRSKVCNATPASPEVKLSAATALHKPCDCFRPPRSRGAGSCLPVSRCHRATSSTATTISPRRNRSRCRRLGAAGPRRGRSPWHPDPQYPTSAISVGTRVFWMPRNIRATRIGAIRDGEERGEPEEADARGERRSSGGRRDLRKSPIKGRGRFN